MKRYIALVAVTVVACGGLIWWAMSDDDEPTKAAPVAGPAPTAVEPPRPADPTIAATDDDLKPIGGTQPGDDPSKPYIAPIMPKRYILPPDMPPPPDVKYAPPPPEPPEVRAAEERRRQGVQGVGSAPVEVAPDPAP